MNIKEPTIKQPKNQRTSVVWTAFQAIAVAEGFEPNENPEAEIEAWAVIGINGLHQGLQGFFGRSLRDLVEADILYPSYEINWDKVDSYLNETLVTQ